MPCPVYKIDSNVTGLRFAEEECLKQLPVTPIWRALEPNTYSDFGGSITTVARAPIKQSRGRAKGVTTDLEASGGFNQDLTYHNTVRLMQGFLFADAREKKTTQPINGDAAIVITGVTTTDDRYAAASGLGTFKVGSLILASGFTNAANNGLKVVDEINAAYVGVSSNLTDEVAPPADAQIETVGYQFAAGDNDITLNGSLVRLTSAAVDFTTLGLVAGEWIFIGGDGAGSYFTNNRGFARISAITAGYLEFDKTDWEGAAEDGAAVTLQVFFGGVIKNEDDPDLIVRRTYQLERTLGQDEDGTMSEYLVGAVANELTLNVPQAEKATVDFSFMACDHEARTGLEGVKSGTRVGVVEGDAFNTSSDVLRIRLGSVDATDAYVTPLFAFASDLSLTIQNNASGAKAIGTLGSFEVNIGSFDVGGSLTAYFASVAGVQAVRNNEDITLDVILVKSNLGLLFDIPLLSLGNGRLNVEKDQPITIPLDTTAAESSFGHTLMFQYFPYLPNAAA